MATNAVMNLVSASMGDRLLAAARVEEITETRLLLFRRTRVVDHFADFLLKNSEVKQLEGLLQNPLVFFAALDPDCFAVSQLPELNERMRGLGDTHNLAIDHHDGAAIAGRLQALDLAVDDLSTRWSALYPGFDYDPLPELTKARDTLLRWMAMITDRKIGVLRIRQ